MAASKDIKLPIDPVVKGYVPDGKEKDLQSFMIRRIEELKDHRKAKLKGNSRSIEDICKEADREYQPHELSADGRMHFASDDETGLRSRLVKAGEEGNWQSNMASPDLYVKVNTALSILVDQNLEAVFVPGSKKYEDRTILAYSLWKNGWEASGAKQQLKSLVFNLSK